MELDAPVVFPGDRNVRIDAAKPCLFPVDPAPSLATAVPRPVTPKILEEDGVPHPSASVAPADRVADLFDSVRHREALSDMAEHLRHERHAFDRAVSVQGREDLRGGPHLNHITGPQPASSPHVSS
jgi:hypothetical protein